MRLSRKTDYAWMFLGMLKREQEGAFVSVAAIAERNRLPQPFFEKIAMRLKVAGLLEARRGVNGGYRLYKNPIDITLAQVAEIFEEQKQVRCLESARPDKSCVHAAVCPVRKDWRTLETKMQKLFEEMTLANP